MKILFDQLSIRTTERLQLLDITGKVIEALKKANIRDGFINLSSLHTTTSILLNEFQSALLEDIRGMLGRLVDDNDWYRHNSAEFSDCERRNAVSHLRGLILGTGTLCLQVAKGKLVLGQFQSVIFAELDGPRERGLQIQLVGE
ncbi:YjbQ family protein [Candidatus Poribacteria bacterium]|nr:YjbQ family protein [Candidatus Poribacteria bacterium]